MKKSSLIAATLLLSLTTGFSHANGRSDKLPAAVTVADNDKAAIEKVITAYRDALKEANVSKVVALYTKDAVLMPPAAPTAVGQQQVKATYEYVFNAIKLDINFTIDDIVVNGNNAFVRSTSKGTATVNANGQTGPEENRELFVFQKVGGQWKIARYMYNKTK
ncbi:SgcJ/EcaC family oxidoreductase [Hymenobacter sp. GOD-10R]|uniref:YybH family protein n=1 Tax=Hymenobacter sp. GOD-10R TaxID=3093922 RepID=UPI002D77E391|nr:SgcJ/EcaC family oxidoreductase [Hymenobacter sp. GOD-10R]WRQ31670.1 SgcJ/EcaC family oxidoreductase [Hymenobacter sp. GOD-10R]